MKFGSWSIHWGACLLALSLLFGCQSSPTKQYFVLTAIPSQIEAGSTRLDRDIGIGPVEIAEYLNFTQVVYQREDGSLQRFTNSYWAEPLDQGISRVIRLNLSQGDRSRNLILFPWRADNRPQYSIKIKIISLNRDGVNARMNANWELIDIPSNRHIERQHFAATTEAGSTAAELVNAYSYLLAQLAQEIDKSLQRLPN
ncbi:MULTISPECIES: PqiC family protein [Shewanella]|uniref:Membrane integrity-associated transporter subunit PqiC n=1 Tax=Shewanella psychromarinicola TaxID=2487742 RepID=A0A3N4EB88_9GAMM|nr:PqiC family protein [Shewanella psychromarinicola]AZG36326.1 membrane integrity-associated transporter subunit PqiC [Shewanella psychromarinicola]MCL1080802.1 PqiC family protein [Shewanella psychromarinicola]RPA34167.1 membrane integrity-associated transporter subunit PqiC [Shewanella psychromarinicola]